jgi:hypothetical protein
MLEKGQTLPTGLPTKVHDTIVNAAMGTRRRHVQYFWMVFWDQGPGCNFIQGNIYDFLYVQPRQQNARYDITWFIA